MPFEPIGLITLAVAFVAVLRGRDFAVYAFMASTLFGAAAAVNGPGIGSIQPAQLLLVTLIVTVAAEPGGLRRSGRNLRFPAPGFWLLCTWIYGVFCAIFLPRVLYAGFLVNPIGSSSFGDAVGQTPFGPTTGNVSQSIYFTGDLLCFVVCRAVAGTPNGFRTVIGAVFVYCVGDVALALIDLGTYYTGTASVLDFIRNAKYTIYVDDELSNVKRIIGSFTEASAFAGATLGVFGFCLRAWMENLRPRLSLSLALASFVLLLLSTSSTAYVGLAVVAVLFCAHSVWTIVRGRASAPHVATAVLGPLLAACCLLGIVLHPPTYDALRDVLDGAVFNKAASQSGVDRGLLNQAAVQNVVDTWGLGTGIGGVRTSSFLLAVLANLGVLGSVTYAAFIGAALIGSRRPEADHRMDHARAAARAACVCLVISASISGALVDLGLPFFVFAALASAYPRRNIAPAPRAVPASVGPFGPDWLLGRPAQER